MLPQNKPDRIRILFDDHSTSRSVGSRWQQAYERGLGRRILH